MNAPAMSDQVGRYASVERLCSIMYSVWQLSPALKNWRGRRGNVSVLGWWGRRPSKDICVSVHCTGLTRHSSLLPATPFSSWWDLWPWVHWLNLMHRQGPWVVQHHGKNVFKGRRHFKIKFENHSCASFFLFKGWKPALSWFCFVFGGTTWLEWSHLPTRDWTPGPWQWKS